MQMTETSASALSSRWLRNEQFAIFISSVKNQHHYPDIWRVLFIIKSIISLLKNHVTLNEKICSPDGRRDVWYVVVSAILWSGSSVANS